MIDCNNSIVDRVSETLYLHGGTVPPVRGDCEQVMRGDKKVVGGGTLSYRNQLSVKSVFVCSTHIFHNNICYTVCLNSAGFCDSAMVNVGC